MVTSRRLALRREALVELDTAELRAAGGDIPWSMDALTCPANTCKTLLCSDIRSMCPCTPN